ncbi:MAG: peptidylprolyl isomerase [Rhodothermales bacterium]|nr:peptidylprolyl isomerase [Rhodothermales bacterium]MBO6778354.1 peptidylprolyl isomerase [Rhodothermales bacterium]
MRTVSLLLVVALAGCSASDPITQPSLVSLHQAAPDSFEVRMETSEGALNLRLYRNWSPEGVDRAYYLFRNNFYEGARFYRVVEDFVAQFGGSGDPVIDEQWRQMPLNDEPVRASNERGTLSFARAGARTRSFTMFINLKDNIHLDADRSSRNVVGFPPIGRVVEGMDIVERLFSAYGNEPMRTDLGARTLAAEYPELDSIAVTTVVRAW